MTIPAAVDTAPVMEEFAAVSPQSQAPASVVLEYRFGQPQRKFWFLIAGGWVFGFLFIPLAIFGNEGWAIGRSELPPWSMMLTFGILGLIFLGMGAYYTGGYFFQRSNPQRVAITTNSVIVPKNLFSSDELVIPFSAIRKLKLVQAGPFLQINFRHSEGNKQLHSGLFPSDEAAETFAEHLQERVG
jgi:hypothetical protein